jgi:hypothetical protein
LDSGGKVYLETSPVENIRGSLFDPLWASYWVLAKPHCKQHNTRTKHLLHTEGNKPRKFYWHSTVPLASELFYQLGKMFL